MGKMDKKDVEVIAAIVSVLAYSVARVVQPSNETARKAADDCEKYARERLSDARVSG